MNEENEKLLQTKTLLIAEKMMQSCRLCLQKLTEAAEVISIFQNIDEESPTTTYSELAMTVAKIQITIDDTYPKSICSNCTQKLQILHEFRKKCELSDCTLKAVITLGESIKQDLIAHRPNPEEYFDPIIIADERENEDKCWSSNNSNIKINSDDIENIDDIMKYEELQDIIEESSSDCFSINNLPAATNDDATILLDLTDDTYSLIEVAEDCIGNDLSDYDNLNGENEKDETDILQQSQLVNISKTILLHNEHELESYTKAKKRVRQMSVPAKRFQCEECGKTYRRKSDLQQHSTLHTGLKRFSCDLCATQFTRKAHLIAHMLIHNKLKPYTCDECGQSFRKLGNLSRHKLVHVNIFNFSCEICGKLFKRAEAVKSHMRTHSGMQPYKCGGCSNAYTSYSGYRRHIKRNICGRAVGQHGHDGVQNDVETVTTEFDDATLLPVTDGIDILIEYKNDE